MDRKNFHIFFDMKDIAPNQDKVKQEFSSDCICERYIEGKISTLGNRIEEIEDKVKKIE